MKPVISSAFLYLLRIFYHNVIILPPFVMGHSQTAIDQNDRTEHHPYYYWYNQDESLETRNGKLPTLSCPLGKYRDFGNKYLRKPGGIRLEGCLDCPKGRYGDRNDLKNSLCSGTCPLGTYLDETGGKSINDCKMCPKGTYGDGIGLETASCSGHCTDRNNGNRKYYSDEEGLVSWAFCKRCPRGYRGWQCKWSLRISNESGHHYSDADTGEINMDWWDRGQK